MQFLVSVALLSPCRAKSWQNCGARPCGPVLAPAQHSRASNAAFARGAGNSLGRAKERQGKLFMVTGVFSEPFDQVLSSLK